MSISLPLNNPFPENSSSENIKKDRIDNSNPSTPPPPVPGKFGKVKATVKDGFGKVTQLLNDNPKYRMVLYSVIIAVSIISMIGLMVATQGMGMAALGLAPMLIMGVGAGILLMHELGNRSSAGYTAKRIAAVVAPLLVLAAGAALIVGASIASGGGILMLSSPLLWMGLAAVASTFAVIKFSTMPALAKTSKFVKKKKIPSASYNNQNAKPSPTTSLKENQQIQQNRRTDEMDQSRNNNSHNHQ